MNTKVTLFRGNVAAPAPRHAQATNFKANNTINIRSGVRRVVPARNVLIAVWRVNPVSGRLECRWTTQRSAATDEGVSRNDFFRQAA